MPPKIVFRRRELPNNPPDGSPNRPAGNGQPSAVNRPTLPLTFRPRLISDLDKRTGIAHELARRIRAFRDAARTVGPDYVTDLLCHRAAFLSLVVESAECDAVINGTLDANAWTQNVNALLGLLRQLGIDARTVNGRAG